MLRSGLIALAATAALAAGAPATTAPAMTVDELVAKYLAARGGMDKIQAVKTMRATGRMFLGQGMEAPFVAHSKRPNLFRVDFTVMGMTGTQAFDGTTAWQAMPFTGKKDPEAMTGDEARITTEEADFDGPLVNWKEKEHALELVGREQVEGADTYKLKLTRKGGLVSHIWLDAEHFLEIKGAAKRRVRGNEVDGESSIGDYKEVGGVMYAHVHEMGAVGSPMRQKRVVDKIEINVDIPDSLFRMPAVEKPAAADSAAAGETRKPEAGKKP